MKPCVLESSLAIDASGFDAPAAVTRALAEALEGKAPSCARFGIDPRHLERALFANVREFLSRPGKAFRARLVETAFALNGADPRCMPREALAAVEILHAGSLIVDDIQDDAEVRRGAPALHRQVGVPLALNAGNWLYFVALEQLDRLALDPLKALATTRAAHVCLMRCHEGQALDLSMSVPDVRRAEVAALALTTSQLKTGALMAFAARLGATVGGASPSEVEQLALFGERVGVALQMLDDLGSFVSRQRRDKALEDLRGLRVNWVWAWAVESLDPVTYLQLARQTDRGENLDEVRERLAQVVEPLGRLRIREGLEDALTLLEPTFGSSAALRTLGAELVRLEKSYG